MSFFDLFRPRKPRQPDRVSFTGEDVTLVRSSGVVEKVRWDDLQEVGILTTDQGPFVDDVFFILAGSNEKSGCVVPQEAEGSVQLLTRLQELPGFDNEAVCKAMVSTSNARFLCWKRSPDTRVP